MAVAHEQVKCPKCKEPIHPDATRCKHCQSDLAEAKKAKPTWFARFNTFRTGFLVGIVFTLILLMLAYLQFKAD